MLVAINASQQAAEAGPPYVRRASGARRARPGR